MAVTQQLVRISAKQRLIYSTNNEELQRLLSFESEPFDSYIDLNWSPQNLIYAVYDVLGSEVGKKFAFFFWEDGEILNANCPFGLEDDPVYSKVTVVSHAYIVDLITMLFKSSSTSIAKAASHYKNEDLANPIDFYLDNYIKLCDFLVIAVNNDDELLTLN